MTILYYRIRLEFKVASTFGLVRFCEGINRIRLEFKAVSLPTTRKIRRINRIRLEFKDENMVAEPSVGRTGINRIRLEF